MLEAERGIFEMLDAAGCLATEEALQGLATDGSRMGLGDDKWFSRGQAPKIYQTPMAR
jgi:hypothetical protein